MLATDRDKHLFNLYIIYTYLIIHILFKHLFNLYYTYIQKMSDTAFGFPGIMDQGLDNRIVRLGFKSVDWRHFFYLRLRQMEETLNQL